MRGPGLIDSLPVLVEKGLISGEQAVAIRKHYDATNASANRSMLLFSILGGILIGLGIILVIAHNWEDLGRGTRTVLAFVPLLIGQCLVLFTLRRRPEDPVWREGSSLFLFLGVGACLSLISQLYHSGGSLGDLLLVWSLLVLPLLYVPGSAGTLMLYLGMITWYGLDTRTGGYPGGQPWMVLPLFALAVPAFLNAARERGEGAAFFWAALVMALSIGIMSQLFWQEPNMAIAVAIASLSTAYVLAPAMFTNRNLRLGAFTFTGTFFMLGVLVFMSYGESWELQRSLVANDLAALIVFLFIGVGAYMLSLRGRRPLEGSWLPESLFIIIPAWLVSKFSPVFASLLVNLWLLTLGVRLVLSGVHEGRLARMNLGLAVIAMVIALRFFDMDIHFAFKGLIFILLGIGFLTMNLQQVRKRKHTGDA
jgi:uncharacterized membrane protein